MANIRFPCPQCGQHFEAPAEAAGSRVECPTCRDSVEIPACLDPSGHARPACPYCQSSIPPSEAKVRCPACNLEYHSECWEENGGCSAYGCAQSPRVEQRQSVEVAMAHWGQENKRCPRCGREILAAAARCRYCGSALASTAPEDAAAYRERVRRVHSLPSIRRTVVWVFLLSIVPCTAPVGAVWGWSWHRSQKELIRALPAVYAALGRIGLAVAIGQSAFFVIVLLIYALFRG